MTSLKDHLSRAAKARWAKRTPEERSQYAKMMVTAREAKRKAKYSEEQKESRTKGDL